jgi:hypothetical protein
VTGRGIAGLHRGELGGRTAQGFGGDWLTGHPRQDGPRRQDPSVASPLGASAAQNGPGRRGGEAAGPRRGQWALGGPARPSPEADSRSPAAGGSPRVGTWPTAITGQAGAGQGCEPGGSGL